MRLFCAGATAAFLLAAGAAWAETLGSCDQPIEAPLHMRANLVINSRPAQLDIVGTDRESIRISCTVDHDRAEDVRLRYAGDASSGRLIVEHNAPDNSGLHIRVEIPRKANLRIHLGAGQIDVSQVEGDKDIDLYAGQLTIADNHPSAYHSVDASVAVGEVDASAWGVDKGGFFRTFHRETSGGEYHLRAHITTGEIDLR